ncbi:MAG: cardiolipin synthase B [Planctomycetota bacterium]|nr:MAG: cardiolipin synthase B [Planctomycetota bacterium]
MLGAAALAAVVTLAVTIIYLNLMPSEKQIERSIEHVYAVGSPQFTRCMSNLLGPPLIAGNAVTVLQNGDEIFPAMLEAIGSAQRSICFETYIYWSGIVGERFSDALAERARAGVRVHVLLDWVGTHLDDELLDPMREAGVQLELYHPLHWYTLARFNNRTHRKLLIVDGRIGFTGGVGIADVWLGDAQDPDHWRESHFRLEGPAVGQMQAAFIDNWIKTRSELLHGEDYFPEAPAAGGFQAQVFTSSPTSGSENVRLMYLLSIASAREHVRLSASYFVPDELSTRTLVAALQRGVRVEAILPGKHMDVEITRKASRARWGPLLEAGMEIYEYQPTMYHCKVMIVDDQWVSVGSTNFDNRSFRMNDEANLNVLDPGFARELAQVFEEDKRRSLRITLEEWRRRPLREKLAEAIADLLGDLL